MKRTNKKGFTIVELVIVIAVIAILAAVLIPTFASLVKKAHESTDVQAVKNMNTYLAAENATGDIKSILDVYDVFEGSGYVVKNYAPLYEGRQFFYSVEDNQIVYVDSESRKIVFPENMEGQTQGSKTWLSLNMQGVVSAEPTGDAGSYKYTSANGETKAKIEATVKTAEGYLYVIEKYNELSNEGKTALDLELTIDGVIDMMGTSCTIAKANGKVTIQAAEGEGGEAKTAVLKNITSTDTYVVSSNGTQGAQNGVYNASALIADMGSSPISITGITLENANVRTLEGGNVAFLVGHARGKVEIENVTIKNSTVIGHRNVGALIGNGESSTEATISGAITMENVAVKTVGGRSARLIGLIQTSSGATLTTTGMTLTETNFTLSIYENAASKQDTKASQGSCVGRNNPDCYIKSIEKPYTEPNETPTYPYWNDADILVGTGNAVTAQKWDASSSEFKNLE